jgi:surface antigen
MACRVPGDLPPVNGYQESLSREESVTAHSKEAALQVRYLRFTATAVMTGVIGVLSMTSTPARAASPITVSGTVQCLNGKAVDGVWVASTGGGSRFAAKTYLPGTYSQMQYSASVLSGNIQVRVGCGGSTPTANWGTANNSPWRVLGGSRTLNAFCNGSGACSWPAIGNKTTRNLGVPGNCTWEALAKWYAYEGYYPLWSGNAYLWSTTAAQNHWTVTSVPMSQSIVVFPISNVSPVGHVAWVNSVTVSGGNVLLSITEMNLRQLYVIDTRTVTANSALRYIVAPD